MYTGQPCCRWYTKTCKTRNLSSLCAKLCFISQEFNTWSSPTFMYPRSNNGIRPKVIARIVQNKELRIWFQSKNHIRYLSSSYSTCTITEWMLTTTNFLSTKPGHWDLYTNKTHQWLVFKTYFALEYKAWKLVMGWTVNIPWLLDLIQHHPKNFQHHFYFPFCVLFLRCTPLICHFFKPKFQPYSNNYFSSETGLCSKVNSFAHLTYQFGFRLKVNQIMRNPISLK